MSFVKSKKLKIIGASALAFLLAITTSFLLSTSAVDAKSKKTQTTVMMKQQTTETPPSTPTKKRNDKKETSPQETNQTSSKPQVKPQSIEERIQEDLQKAREAQWQNKDVEAFRTACSVANTIKRNQLDQKGANAQAFQKYCQEAIEIAQASGERLQKKNNDHDKPLVFIF